MGDPSVSWTSQSHAHGGHSKSTRTKDMKWPIWKRPSDVPFPKQKHRHKVRHIVLPEDRESLRGWFVINAASDNITDAHV